MNIYRIFALFLGLVAILGVLTTNEYFKYTLWAVLGVMLHGITDILEEVKEE